MTEPTFPHTGFAKVRGNKRAHYDRKTIFEILDKGMVGHVGFVTEGRPMVIPMAYARIEDKLYLHGAKAGRIIKSQEDRAPVCLTVTHIDGLVVARSAFHHSVNYRSAVIHGSVRAVLDADEKELALIAVTNHILPGRWEEVRPMNRKEFNATGVLALEIQGASAKIRQGPPVEEDNDYLLPIWGGVLPVTGAIGQPINDGRLIEGTEAPPSLKAAATKFAY